MDICNSCNLETVGRLRADFCHLVFPMIYSLIPLVEQQKLFFSRSHIENKIEINGMTVIACDYLGILSVDCFRKMILNTHICKKQLYSP